MIDDSEAPTELHRLVPVVVLEATRSLLWLTTHADARRIAQDLIERLGGTVVPSSSVGPGAIPADVSFGEGGPLVASAPPGSRERELLEEHLATFLLDARRALELTGRTERLVEEAATDPLTGLANRRMLMRALSRLGDDDVVIMIDLDHFKQVNDQFGHAAGDEVLRAFGGALQAGVRARDFVGRFGGEEFVVVLTPSFGADPFLERLRSRWRAERPRPVDFSAGIARSSGDSRETLGQADEALYRAKAEGRNRWRWAKPRLAGERTAGVAGR